ncbi:hypothetical protein JCM5350_008352 [Sporobolomyces pararoseus]
MSLLEPTIAIVPPRLPPELIDEILRENELSNSDLAQCCLVSRQFLPSAQRSLYTKVEVSLRCVYDVYHVYLPVKRYYLRSTKKLWRTLKENPLLVPLCYGFLICEILDSYEGGDRVDYEKEVGSRSQVARDWLGLLKGVRNLATTISGNVFIGRQYCNILHLKLDSTVASFPAGLETSGVKRLKLSQDPYGTAIKDFAIPSTVVTFDYSSLQGWSLLPAANPALRNLSINIDRANTINLSTFPNLDYLSISGHGTSRIDPKGLSDLTRLRRIRLDFQVYTYSVSLGSSNSLKAFIPNLPSSVYRLDFPRSIPFRALTPVLNGSDVSITQLGFSKIIDGAERFRLDPLKESCRRIGIEVFNLEKEDPIFGEF